MTIPMIAPRIKILRQTVISFPPSPRAVRGVEYGGWRMWCGFCNAYEWSGRDIGTSMDYARRHCAGKQHAGPQ